MNADTDRGHAIVHPDDVEDSYAHARVRGELRQRPTRSAADQLAVTLTPIPVRPDSD